MRFPFVRFVLLAVFTVALATGCETPQRSLYQYNPAPVRTNDAILKPMSAAVPPATEMAEE